MRTTLDLPDPTFRKLKAEASLRGLKLKEIVCQLIEAGLASSVREASQAIPRRSKLPVIRKPTGKKHPALANDRLDEILAMEEGHVGR
jgi:hypothetical protein